MSEAMIQWLATTLLAGFPIQFAFFGLLYEERIHLPTRWALTLNGLYTLISSIVFYVALIAQKASDNIIYLVIEANIVISVLFAIVILVYVAFRDKKGVEFGEDFIKAMYTIDLEINFILSRFSNINNDEVKHLVDHGLSHVLDTISLVLDLDPDEDSHISLLLARNGTFQVLAKKGIPVQRVNSIEQRFRYGQTIVGVAGRAATTLQTIYIQDVTDDSDPYMADWIAVESGERREGCLYCFPIKRGVGASVETPLAVLSITSKRKNAFDSNTTQAFLTRIAAKIEMFIYLLELS